MDEQTRIRTHESQNARLAGRDRKEKRLRFYAATIILALLVPFGALASGTRTLGEAVMTDQQVYPAGAPVLLAGLALLLAGAGAWVARRREMIADANKRWRD